ncbi:MULTISPECIES: TlpA family protein disulfide reductase [Bacillus]|uniref:Redoxin domain-containing protein n=1 Tax=Bacillus glycinifermentans TaxID=1664069 RepID=A0AAJ3Z100_9BACI|nr:MULTISPECIES: redoxin domain-containing protein [Bacillus]KKB71718.1 thiol:disulfide interchange protein tlpA [Bacillus sp. TH008]MDU0069666.1 redoxin domain-containing protein [Bacillus sp. IG6]MED8017953.1 redoxin domain-containing protein [Bacillus glycinifermentans]QAT65465.1 redoxin domain-containing protein [Bacillus glycinifermentans]WKB79473.1 redoxin domain-containing protein [Bacillus glycinifermentans]
MIKKSLAITFLLLLAGFAVWNFAMHKEAEIGIEKGEKAPDFTLPSLKGGEDVSLSDFKGKKVLLNFWATWCKPCRTEMPDMQQLQNEHRDITVLAVNFTSSEKNRKTVEAFADSLALTYPIVLDQEGINAKYGIFSYPTTFIINESGIIEDIVLGTITKKEMEEKLGL